MKKCDLLILVASVASLCCCIDKKYRLAENKYGEQIALQEKEYRIEIDDNCLTSYQVLSAYYDDSAESDYLYAYNSPLHTLDVMDMTNHRFSHIPLASEGENGVLEHVSGIHVHQPDSIWLYSQGILYLINGQGEVRQRTTLPVGEADFIMVDTNFSMATNKIYYNKRRNSIFYLTVIPTEISANYILCEYNLASSEVKTYPLPCSPLEEKVGRNFGWKQFPNVSYMDNEIVYNFPINSNIYRLNIETGEYKVFGGQSSFTPNQVAELVMPYDFQQADTHLLENVHFFEIMFDPWRQLYYRLHLDGVALMQGEDFNKQYLGKEMYLTVFNAGFEVVNETKLASNRYAYANCWGVLHSGFFIACDAVSISEDSEDNFRFDLFRPM